MSCWGVVAAVVDLFGNSGELSEWKCTATCRKQRECKKTR